jgi:hypothetical protein
MHNNNSWIKIPEHTYGAQQNTLPANFITSISQQFKPKLLSNGNQRYPRRLKFSSGCSLEVE